MKIENLMLENQWWREVVSRYKIGEGFVGDWSKKKLRGDVSEL